MGGLVRITLKLSKLLNTLAGMTLTFMMLVTVADVILRSFRKPIYGAYDLVAFSGAVVIGFSLPLTSWKRGHVYVDFLVLKFAPTWRKIFNIATRCLGMMFFFLGGWYLIKTGIKLYTSGEMSPTLQMPFYPIAYGVAFCCFVQCLVSLCDIVKILGDEYE